MVCVSLYTDLHVASYSRMLHVDVYVEYITWMLFFQMYCFYVLKYTHIIFTHDFYVLIIHMYTFVFFLHVSV